MLKYYLYVLMAICLCACRKETQHTSVIDPAIAGSYIVTTYCYVGPPPNYQPVVTTDSLRWSVSLVGDSSIKVNNDTAKLTSINHGAYLFQGVQAVSRTYFVVTFDSAFHSMRGIYNGACDSCGGCQMTGSR